MLLSPIGFSLKEIAVQRRAKWFASYVRSFWIHLEKILLLGRDYHFHTITGNLNLRMLGKCLTCSNEP